MSVKPMSSSEVVRETSGTCHWHGTLNQ